MSFKLLATSIIIGSAAGLASGAVVGVTGGAVADVVSNSYANIHKKGAANLNNFAPLIDDDNKIKNERNIALGEKIGVEASEVKVSENTVQKQNNP